MIPKCENWTCVNVTIGSFEDDIVTGDRSFNISLMESEELEAKRIRINTSSLTVIIDSGLIWICIFNNASLCVCVCVCVCCDYAVRARILLVQVS